ncbi:Carboxylic ester hydrolase [Aphelenchoides bicaudatus]|nr:Carboxylic ester hydrolase [Aphelenchoides bicaudatus]
MHLRVSGIPPHSNGLFIRRTFLLDLCPRALSTMLSPFIEIPILCIQLFVYSTIFQLSALDVDDNVPRIQTDIGQFEGKILAFEDKGQVEAFYGLPFASPPKRFEKPEPPTGDPSEVHSALIPKAACPQITSNPAFQRATSEDCLYLNYMRPANRSNTLLPLVLFVHGGGYQAGTDLMHIQNYMAEHYVLNGIAYATTHYRMGLTGLGSNGDSEFGGNYALWDVRQALLWLHKNSKQLGFDPEHVTLWGYSAGASIVGHLSLSHQTRDLFQNSIQMSGSSINEWSYSNVSVVSTQLVGEKLNCNTNKESLKACLQSATIEHLHEAVDQIVTEKRGSFVNNKFTPRPDGDFFDAELDDLLNSAPAKPTLATLTENEALLFVLYEIFNTTFHVAQSERFSFNPNKFEEILRTEVVTEKQFGQQVDEVTIDYKEALAQYSQFVSDILIVVPQMLEMRQRVQNDWPVFLILNSHNENIRRTFPNAESHETTHGFEYPYLFGWPFVGGTELTATDLQFRDHLVGAVVNFVKYGNPNGLDCCSFAKSTRKDPFLYTKLTTEILKENHLFEKNVKFWETLTQKYGFDMMRGVQVKSNDHLEL